MILYFDVLQMNILETECGQEKYCVRKNLGTVLVNRM